MAKGRTPDGRATADITSESLHRQETSSATRSLGNRERSLARIQRVVAQAKADLKSKIGDPLFLTGIVLYWAEGSKTTRHFQFTNSDPNAIRTMVAWLTRCAEIPISRISARIYAHDTYGHEDLSAFWAVVSGLNRSQFRRAVIARARHRVRKNPTYMGCCRLDVGSSELRWKLRGWQTELSNLLGTRALDEADGGMSERSDTLGRQTIR